MWCVYRSAHCGEAGGQGDITEGARGEDEGEEEEEEEESCHFCYKSYINSAQWRSSVFFFFAHF